MDLPVLSVASLDALFETSPRDTLERSVLPEFLCRQRWFSSKARPIDVARLIDGGPLEPPRTPYMAIVEIRFHDGGLDRYALPLYVLSPDAAARLLETRPGAAIAWLDHADGRLLVDAMADDDACRALLASIGEQREYRLMEGAVLTVRDVPPQANEHDDAQRVTRSGAEQSNSSVIFGRTAILKLYRRLEPGPHPELELGRYLREDGFTDVPAVLGSMEYVRGTESSALGVLHAVVPNATDGWDHALAHLSRYYPRVVHRPPDDAQALCPAGHLVQASRRPIAAEARSMIGEYLDAARTLGTQTAHLHLTLARGTENGLVPEPLNPSDISRVVDSTRARLRRALSQLAARRQTFTPHASERAGALLAHECRMSELLDRLSATAINATRTRVHQDYHLGQLLWTGRRYVLLDFEGEPLRPLVERRAKRSPLTDVAGMLRSYSYAAWSGLFAWSRAHNVDSSGAEAWASLWETAVAVTFLGNYLEATRGASFIPGDVDQLVALLELLMLDKGVYELEYELNNRPDWVLVPVEGLLRLL